MQGCVRLAAWLLPLCHVLRVEHAVFEGLQFVAVTSAVRVSTWLIIQPLHK